MDIKARLSRSVLVCLISLVGAGVRESPGQIILPVEVVGPAGYIDSREITLPARLSAPGLAADSTDREVTPADIDFIWMQANNTGYKHSKAPKGSLRINGGEWVDITNESAACDYPDDRYDCIWGSRSTIRFRMAASGFVPGKNTIEWRFNTPDGNTSGYRIKGFNLYVGDSAILDSEAFEIVDPTTWSFDPALVADGKRLFDTGAITISDLDSTISAAHCVDCHQNGGSDLKRLAFSDKSIIARSVFHGMSVEDGAKIAAYVRSHEAPVVGRPWSPIFQPGPGIDSGTAAEWFAGAGLEWVMDDDIDTLPYLLSELKRMGPEFTKEDLNMRELPQAFQFPDWNEWLPSIAIQDMVSDYDSSAYNRCFTKTLPDLMATDPSIREVAKQFEACVRTPLAIPVTGDPATDANRTLSARQFRVIEALDFLFENDLFDSCEEAYPRIPGDPRAHGEKRCTLGIVSLTFSLAPHRISGNDHNYPYIRENNGVFSSAWYRIAVVLNAGNRYASEQNVIDWKYHMPHISNNTWRGRNHPQFVYYMASYIKLLQQADKDLCADYGFGHSIPEASALFRTTVNIGQCEPGPANDANYAMGWNWRSGNISATAVLDVNRAGYYEPPSARGYPTVEQARSVIEPIVIAHCAVTSQHEPDDWERTLGGLGLTPGDFVVKPLNSRGYFLRAQENATQIYRLLPMWREMGVAEPALQCWANWAQKAWPLNNYLALVRGKHAD